MLYTYIADFGWRIDLSNTTSVDQSLKFSVSFIFLFPCPSRISLLLVFIKQHHGLGAFTFPSGVSGLVTQQK